MENEEWRVVPSAPEISASTLGRVLVAPAQAKMPNGAIRWYNPKPTYGYEEKCASGRSGVGKRKILRVSRMKKTFKIARLVCEAFHGPPTFVGAIVLHLDENPSNNRPENLRWGTRKENQNFPKAKEAFRARVGEKSPWAIHRERMKP